MTCPECGAPLMCARYEVMGFDKWGPDGMVVESYFRVFCNGNPQHSARHEFWDAQVAVRFFRRFLHAPTLARRRIRVT